jgi:geranylgeranyl diphosphate synthase type II
MATSERILELEAERRGVDKALRRFLEAERGIPTRLKQAMAHSLLGGGKRLRPVLMLWTWDAVTARRRTFPADREQVLACACGLEMLHTYSLIHDDLPAMDDDVLRRGRPTCHVAFDEATAILAGDGLQALAFSLLARHGASVAAPLVDRIARAVGPAGMVGGQQEDLDAEGVAVGAHQVRRIHLGKTARLLAAAMAGGALLGGAPADRLEGLDKAGLDLGLAFQGADDILDVTADTERLGKSAGKDAHAEKATWVAVEGLDSARRRTRRYGRTGLKALELNLPAGLRRDRLVALGEMMWNRDR